MTGRSSSPPEDVTPSLPGLPPTPCPGCCPGRHLPFIAAFLYTKTPHPRFPKLYPPPSPSPPTQRMETHWLHALPMGFTIPGTSCAACHRSRPFPPPIKQTRLFRGAPSTFLYLFLFLPLPASVPEGLRDNGGAGDSGRGMKQPRGPGEGHTFGLHGECQWLGKGGWENPALWYKHHRMHPRIPRPSALGDSMESTPA